MGIVLIYNKLSLGRVQLCVLRITITFSWSDDGAGG